MLPRGGLTFSSSSFKMSGQALVMGNQTKADAQKLVADLEA